LEYLGGIVFSLEIRVNAALVGYVYARNLAREVRPGEYLYKYEYYRPESGQVETGEITHKREDGIETLAYKILRKVGA
jgi:hypothetical protein